VIAAIVLAAGEATRFGSPKQELLLPRVLDRLAESPVDEVVVVTGAYPLEREAVRMIPCPEWDLGPGASLRCGLAALGAGVEAAVVCLADGPNLSPQAVRRVLTAWRAGGGSVVAASYEGNRGHPLVLGRGAWDSVPDEGLRAMPAVLVPCDDLGPPGDVDFADDVPERFQSPSAEE
jgi:CTP:molybdopterin cytidylyltransferase MocA